MDDDGDFDIAFSNRDQPKPQRQTVDNEIQKSPQSQNNDYVIKTIKQNNSFNLGSNDFALSKAAHPKICIATVGFKIAAFILYLFGELAPVPIFIFIAILSSLDFWTVKNISGRLLVGLRWWTDYDEKGNEKWKFQSPNKQFQANPVDKTFFWVSQFAFTLIWALVGIIKILTISVFWGMLVALNFFLCGMNLYGFYKCSGDHSKKLKSLKGQAMKNIAGKLF